MDRLTIGLTEEQHRALKTLAAREGKSVGQYALERLFPADADEEAAWSEFKEMMQGRIERALTAPPSNKTFDDILGEALQSQRRP